MKLICNLGIDSRQVGEDFVIDLDNWKDGPTGPYIVGKASFGDESKDWQEMLNRPGFERMFPLPGTSLSLLIKPYNEHS